MASGAGADRKNCLISTVTMLQELPRQDARSAFPAHFATARPVLFDDVESGRKGPAEGNDVANLEERVAIVEAQTNRHADAVEGLRTDLSVLRDELRGEMATLRMELRGEMVALRTEMRSDMAALRTELHGGIEGLRTDLREVSRRTDRFVIWVAGTQAATLLAVIGALVGILYR